MSCPRCQGFVLTQHDETRCLNCGWVYAEPGAPPITVNENRQWIAGTCEWCGAGAMRKKPYCLVCYRKERGEDHGRTVSAGMQAARLGDP